MNIHFGNQSQFELFPGTTGDPIENTAPRFIFSRIVLTFENVVVIFVFVIVSLIITFSIGVERGRMKSRATRVVLQEIPSPAVPSVMPNPRIAVAQVARPTSAVASVPALSGTAIAASEVPVSTRTVSRPTPATSPEKGVDKSYTIQVASYKSEDMAQKESANLKRQGFESFFVIKGSHVIVCVGRFSGQEEAKHLQNKLKKQYKDSIVRSL